MVGKVLHMGSLVLFVTVAAAGCQQKAMKEGENVETVAHAAGIELPATARIESFDDGSGRDAPTGFAAWTIFCVDQIVMPPSFHGKQHEVPLDEAVALVQSEIGHRIVGTPRAAFGASWTHDSYEFRSTLLCTSEGDYLFIERFSE